METEEATSQIRARWRSVADIPHTLMRRFGHADCGIYAEVIAGGSIAPGDDVIVSSWA